MSTSFGAPVVVSKAGDDLAYPLVVLLHGRGSDEKEIIGLANYLPVGPSYVALRAPIAEGDGYAWFANRGVGRPVSESLRDTMAWFYSWLESVAEPSRKVMLVGFSGGAAFAGGLILANPNRFAAAAILYGTLPFDAGLKVAPGQLAGLPVYLAHGDQDRVIPRELLRRTWQYLTSEAGAVTTAIHGPGGHELSPEALSKLDEWIAQLLEQEV